MFNFNEIVDTLLLEEPAVPATTGTPATVTNTSKQWINDLIKKYNELYSSKGDTAKAEDLVKLWPLVKKGYITDSEIVSIGIERAKLLDVLRQIFNSSPFKTKKPSTYEELINVDDNVATSIVDKIKNIKSASEWSILDGDVSRAYNTAVQGADRAGAVALETYNQLTIFNTVQEMVKRRTNVYDRISALKSPTAPFKALLSDIFKTPEQYLSGQKKITSDWSNIVDGVYVTTICNIALNTKNLFQSLLQSPPQQNTDNKQLIARNVRANVGRSQAASRTSNFTNFSQQPVNASLEYFSQLVEHILTEQNAPTSATQPVKDYTKDESAYTNFYVNGILPADIISSKDENNKQIVYNIKKISELVTPEAQKLIASLRNIAHYEKQKPGAGERIAGAQQALQGIASFAGAKLYT